MCHKKCFTLVKARAALIWAKISGRTEERIYWCDSCKSFHLTSLTLEEWYKQDDPDYAKYGAH